MKQITKLEQELNIIEQGCLEQKQALRQQATELLAKKLDNSKKLKAEFSKLENSKNLTWIDDEFPYQWIRFDASDFIDTDSMLERHAFASYVQEYGYTMDFGHNALMSCIGPVILINDEGDILDQDSGKWFIKKSDYENETERNKLIEEYMEKTGCFPAVISCDRYNNAFYVNTKE